MTHKQIETSREIRLWIRDLAMPVLDTATLALSNAKVREKTVNGLKKVKDTITKPFKKKEKTKVVKVDAWIVDQINH